MIKHPSDRAERLRLKKIKFEKKTRVPRRRHAGDEDLSDVELPILREIQKRSFETENN